MSTTQITIERITSVEHHPNADRLDIVQVLGYKVIVGRSDYEVGDSAVYFPPDILIPEAIAADLGVHKYLKNAIMAGDETKTRCRVSACRLRGIPSHGFVMPVSRFHWQEPFLYGHDVTHVFDGEKYIPPVRENAGDAERESAYFPKYTTIENIQKHPGALDGMEVEISEKIHGSSVRMGMILEEGEWVYAAGSHNVRRKSGQGLYWKFMGPGMEAALEILKDSMLANSSVVIYGEIFGHGIQDLDYGVSLGLRIFDIMVDGQYLDSEYVKAFCKETGFEQVPILYRGPFSQEVVEEHTYGPTTFPDVKCRFKDREGCVVRPVTETLNSMGQRLILKSVSADYRNRKGAKDVE